MARPGADSHHLLVGFSGERIGLLERQEQGDKGEEDYSG